MPLAPRSLSYGGGVTLAVTEGTIYGLQPPVMYCLRQNDVLPATDDVRRGQRVMIPTVVSENADRARRGPLITYAAWVQAA